MLARNLKWNGMPLMSHRTACQTNFRGVAMNDCCAGTVLYMGRLSVVLHNWTMRRQAGQSRTYSSMPT